MGEPSSGSEEGLKKEEDKKENPPAQEVTKKRFKG
jgi:hypothetical protein